MFLPPNFVCSAVTTPCSLKIEYVVQNVHSGEKESPEPHNCSKNPDVLVVIVRLWLTWAHQGVQKMRLWWSSLAYKHSCSYHNSEWHEAAGGAATLHVLATNMFSSSLCYMLNCFTCDHVTQAVWSCNGLFYLCGGHLRGELDNIAAFLNGHQLQTYWSWSCSWPLSDWTFIACVHLLVVLFR